jgi:hypothetical protein
MAQRRKLCPHTSINHVHVIKSQRQSAAAVGNQNVLGVFLRKHAKWNKHLFFVLSVFLLFVLKVVMLDLRDLGKAK